jgi:hypothetical protein
MKYKPHFNIQTKKTSTATYWAASEIPENMASSGSVRDEKTPIVQAKLFRPNIGK